MTITTKETTIHDTVEISEGVSIPETKEYVPLPPPPSGKNTTWTPNYNGVNSYVSIPEWKPAGEFEIECDFYRLPSVGSLVGGPADSNKVEMTLAGSYYTSIPNTQSYLNGAQIPNDGTFKVDEGFNKLKITSTSLGEAPISFIGNRGNLDRAFKGQISNLRLTDKTNPQNSRFYPGVIYDYVDPDATKVHMHQTTRLADWGPSAQHGTMVNFGTEQPFVPLLGAREEYAGYFNAGSLVRGVGANKEITSASTFAAYGSFQNDVGYRLPVGSILRKEGVDVQCTRLHGTGALFVDKYDKQVQTAFQYPNTFKVIKPDDPDHPDYKEYDWSLNFNGVNSYVEIPEWEASNLTLEADIYISALVSIVLAWDWDGANNTIRLSGNIGTTGKITSAGLIGSYTVNGVVDGALRVGWNKVKYRREQLGKLTYIGCEWNLGRPFKGQISNLRLTDLDNPANSRFYPVLETARHMPTETVVKDELCKPVDVSLHHGVHWTQSGTTYTRENTPGYAPLEVRTTAQGPGWYKLEVGAVSEGAEFHWTLTGPVKPNTTYYAWLTEEVRQGIDRNGGAIVIDIKVTKVTHGIANNFGTDAPWVPHLEEEGAYLGNYTEGEYIAGIKLSSGEMTSTSSSAQFGTWYPNSRPPIDSFLEADNGSIVRVAAMHPDNTHTLFYEVVKGTDREIQLGFEWPNSFKVTVPEDPDHPSKLPPTILSLDGPLKVVQGVTAAYTAKVYSFNGADITWYTADGVVLDFNDTTCSVQWTHPVVDGYLNLRATDRINGLVSEARLRVRVESLGVMGIEGPASAGVGWHKYTALNASGWGDKAVFDWSVSGQPVKSARANGNSFKFLIEDTTYNVADTSSGEPNGNGNILVYCNVWDPYDNTSANLSYLTKFIHKVERSTYKPKAVLKANDRHGMLKEGKELILDPTGSVLSFYRADYTVRWTFDSDHVHFQRESKVTPYPINTSEFIDSVRGTVGYVSLSVKMEIMQEDCVLASTSKRFVIDNGGRV